MLCQTAPVCSHRLPFSLVVVVLGMWMGSLRAPRRWTVRSWMTSRMCLIQSCLFSMLEAWGSSGRVSESHGVKRWSDCISRERHHLEQQCRRLPGHWGWEGPRVHQIHHPTRRRVKYRTSIFRLGIWDLMTTIFFSLCGNRNNHESNSFDWFLQHHYFTFG